MNEREKRKICKDRWKETKTGIEKNNKLKIECVSKSGEQTNGNSNHCLVYDQVFMASAHYLFVTGGNGELKIIIHSHIHIHVCSNLTTPTSSWTMYELSLSCGWSHRAWLFKVWCFCSSLFAWNGTACHTIPTQHNNPDPYELTASI